MSLRNIAYAFGAVFVLIGIAGYIDALTPDGRLFGLFAVNGPHNVIHLATGIAAIGSAAMGAYAARRFFQVFAVVYGLVTVLGLFVGQGMLLGVVAHNHHDIWLHALITAVSAWLGFATSKRLAHA
jgi:hypothetical protein